ncbi:hypothetical protein [Wolbachia endosymbiont of Mansonella ozzardi]|uniref:hypothetical protein n=1 Tax=Wolbachia endosymbiont of Mansonella ozzardi TaxID=137464 RepID=UPI001CE14B6B|nr:hypothetical protein [Wolbachia endosymbiont of Mansonella ozzardi]
MEELISGIKREIHASYAKSWIFLDDVIVEIRLELVDWRFRRKARHILNDIRSSVQDMKEVITDIQEENSGPSAKIQYKLISAGMNLA